MEGKKKQTKKTFHQNEFPKKEIYPLVHLDLGNAIFCFGLHLTPHMLLFTSNFVHLQIKDKNSGWPWPV